MAILFADRVIEEKNGKKGIIGTFTQFNTDKFPVIFAPWYIFIAVTNIEGEHNFSVNLANDVLKQVVFNRNGKLGSKDINAVVEITLPVYQTIFPKEGTYTLTFYIDGKQVGARFLQVKQIKQSD